MYVPSTLNDVMAAGTTLVFDEFSSVTHELRAFLDYVSCVRRPYSLLATSGRFACPDQVAILLE